MVTRPPREAVELLEAAIRRSKRSASVRVPQAFARDRQAHPPMPPLATLLQGGGEVRIKVLLTVLMMATKSPHATRVASKDLAAMLNLPSPETAGSRRVNKALADLEKLNLVRRERKPGYVPNTQVLDPGGTGEDWDDRNLPEGYIALPLDLWRRGWLLVLSGRAVALLIILRELTHGRASKGAWADGIRKRQYGLSEDTWTKATKELVDAGLLDIREDVYSSHGEPRRRNVYTLHLERLSVFDPGDTMTFDGEGGSFDD